MHMENEEEANASQEYSMDHIVCHVRRAYNVKYVLRCFAYTPLEDTLELPAHIPEHFITRC